MRTPSSPETVRRPTAPKKLERSERMVSYGSSAKTQRRPWWSLELTESPGRGTGAVICKAKAAVLPPADRVWRTSPQSVARLDSLIIVDPGSRLPGHTSHIDDAAVATRARSARARAPRHGRSWGSVVCAATWPSALHSQTRRVELVNMDNVTSIRQVEKTA